MNGAARRAFIKQTPAGNCALCGARRAVVVDHDHQTGYIRGWLCEACNTGLGMFGDSLARLRQAEDYLERSRIAQQRDLVEGLTRALLLKGREAVAAGINRGVAAIHDAQRRGAPLPAHDAELASRASRLWEASFQINLMQEELQVS